MNIKRCLICLLYIPLISCNFSNRISFDTTKQCICVNQGAGLKKFDIYTLEGKYFFRVNKEIKNNCIPLTNPMLP